MNESTVKCPECGAEIKLSETLAAPIIDAERAKIEAKFKERFATVKQREDEIEKETETLSRQKAEVDCAKADIEKAVANRVEKERASIAKQAGAAATKAATAELEAVRKDLAAKDAKLVEAQKAELEVRQERKALEDEKREYDLKLTRAVDAERDKIREATRKEDEAHYRLKVAEKDKVIADMQKQVEELRRKGEQGSQQLQGEVQELDLRSMLERAFPYDIIEDVPKGQHGGDVLQRVVGANGRQCGTILWESKRTKAWSDGWLSKLRDDQRDAKAEIAAIMSATLPKDLTTFDRRDGVWVTGPACVIPVSTALRQTLIEAASARQALENQQGKMEMIYGYLTSSHFKQRVTAMVESYVGLRTELESERRAFNRIWAKREKQLDRMLGGVTGMYGDLQGIVGASLPAVEGLELPMLEAPAHADDAQNEDTDNPKTEAA